MIKIYTDGSCLENPGNGGWAAIIIINKEKKIISGNQKNTTNNRMELLAPIEALKTLEINSEIEIITDSKYVKSGITEWINNWKKNGWKTTSKKEVKNKILWEELDKEISKHNVEWKWIKGHSGNQQNEIADSWAKS